MLSARSYRKSLGALHLPLKQIVPFIFEKENRKI
jgi:hypothetical protein